MRGVSQPRVDSQGRSVRCVGDANQNAIAAGIRRKAVASWAVPVALPAFPGVDSLASSRRSELDRLTSSPKRVQSGRE